MGTNHVLLRFKIDKEFFGTKSAREKKCETLAVGWKRKESRESRGGGLIGVIFYLSIHQISKGWGSMYAGAAGPGIGEAGGGGV